jgi:hypothetical protein
MVGLVLSKINPNINITLTDREIDLCEINIKDASCDPYGAAGVRAAYADVSPCPLSDPKVSVEHAGGGGAGGGADKGCSGDALYSPQGPVKRPSGSGGRGAKKSAAGQLTADPRAGAVSGDSAPGCVRARELLWGVRGDEQCQLLLGPEPAASSLLNTGLRRAGAARLRAPHEYPDLIVGAEIAVLHKQQEALVHTIARLAGPLSLVRGASLYVHAPHSLRAADPEIPHAVPLRPCRCCYHATSPPRCTPIARRTRRHWTHVWRPKAS